MPKNYLIGIGGTGAKVVEATLFMCAAGYGPDELSIFLIDPDKGNGNLARTTQLISKYLECQKYFKSANPSTKLFKTKVKTPDEEKDRVWNIFKSTDATLKDWIGEEGMQGAEKDLANILFSKLEMTTQLNEGFRGHPAIGSVVMTEIPDNELPFKLLWDEIPGSKAFDVRVFLVGSVFGGTGAAGFPTLGHKNVLKFNPDKKKDTFIGNESEGLSRVLLGGALVLPYFKVVKNGNVPGMYVTSNDFPIATKAALEFYNTKDNLGFDQIYFLGDSIDHSVGEFSVGSTSQKNKPHYIEVVSGLAALDFFDQPAVNKKTDPMYFIAKRDTEILDWTNLPFTRNQDILSDKRAEFKELITTMTIFSYVFVTYVESIRNSKNDSTNEHEYLLEWYKSNFKHKQTRFSKFKNIEEEKRLNIREASNKEILDKFTLFTEDFLKWIVAFDEYSNVNLIDKSQIVDENGWTDPFNQPFVGYLLKESSKKEGWTTFVTKGIDDAEINRSIQENAKNFSAANRIINLFYEGSNTFAKSNYTIKK